MAGKFNKYRSTASNSTSRRQRSNALDRIAESVSNWLITDIEHHEPENRERDRRLTALSQQLDDQAD